MKKNEIYNYVTNYFFIQIMMNHGHILLEKACNWDIGATIAIFLFWLKTAYVIII